MISDLDPIRSFGIALSFGVISAFLNAVFVVGALHVLFDRDEADSVAPELRFPRLTSSIVTLQSTLPSSSCSHCSSPSVR